MSLLSEYYREREGQEVIETEHGFVTYRLFPQTGECYIVNVYISPTHRRTRLASELGNKVTRIAKEKGCTTITGSVDPRANGATESAKFLFSYGFKLLKCDSQLIYFFKEI